MIIIFFKTTMKGKYTVSFNWFGCSNVSTFKITNKHRKTHTKKNGGRKIGNNHHVRHDKFYMFNKIIPR